ncbi:tripartite motif-containing protein 16 isoform X2 [Erpetoichthys calabaricus]|uniref:tripartite motif-containing protein 16 isoform X2 n=1 Tax=Erpetoichthys calabaricus TaxID=27687 RepID=UPI0022343887|nr:tripartite motif-containing protein 16 isoform X2 [Erpetoichthys calabaricus]
MEEISPETAALHSEEFPELLAPLGDDNSCHNSVADEAQCQEGSLIPQESEKIEPEVTEDEDLQKEKDQEQEQEKIIPMTSNPTFSQQKDEILGPETVACDFCIETQRKAHKSCLTCLVSYCGDHLRSHLEKSKFQNHRLVEPLQDIEQHACEGHKRPLELFCLNDSCCVCQDCVVEEHRGHRTATLGDARGEVETELQKVNADLEKKLTAAESAIGKPQINTTSIENSVKESKMAIEEQFSDLLEAVRKAKRDVFDFLEAEENAAMNQADGIKAHLEQKCAELKKTQSQIKNLAKIKNDVQFLQDYGEWKKHASDDSLPSVYIGLKDRLNSYMQVVTESSQNIQGLLHSSYKDKIKALSKAEKFGIKTTVAAIVPPKHHITAPEPKCREDFLQYASLVTFDPDTTHKFLRLTEDNRKVTNTSPWQHPYPERPERFEHWRQLMGAESFYLSRHYFEVELRGEASHVGLTYKSINRKGTESNSCITGNDFSWCLAWTGKDFSYWHCDVEKPLNVGNFSRIGIYVDFPRGSLAFYGITESMKLLHKVNANFSEPLYVVCWLPRKENTVLLVNLGAKPSPGSELTQLREEP